MRMHLGYLTRRVIMNIYQNDLVNIGLSLEFGDIVTKVCYSGPVYNQESNEVGFQIYAGYGEPGEGFVSFSFKNEDDLLNKMIAYADSFDPEESFKKKPAFYKSGIINAYVEKLSLVWMRNALAIYKRKREIEREMERLEQERKDLENKSADKRIAEDLKILTNEANNDRSIINDVLKEDRILF